MSIRTNLCRRMLNRARRGALPLALAGLLAAPAAALAQPAPAGADAVTAPVRNLDQALLQAMRAGRATPFRQRFATLDSAIGQDFDLNLIVQHVVGLQWSQLPPAQQQQLLTAYRNYAVASYASNFDSYSGQSFQVSPQPRALPNGQEIVQTRLVSPGSAPTELDYVMQNVGGHWRVVDVLADGAISQVATQRSDFRNLLRDGTGQRLIATLQRKVSTLSDGALA